MLFPYFCKMKIAVKLTLLMFILFLSTPTIVSAIEKSCDTSIFFNVTEEELSHNVVNAKLEVHEYIFVDLSAFLSRKILSEVFLRHDSISLSIVIPPPDQA